MSQKEQDARLKMSITSNNANVDVTKGLQRVSSTLSGAKPSCRAAHIAHHSPDFAYFTAGLLGDSPLREGLVSGFLLIFFSELGDKTFFIAVLLALKYPLRRKLVFAGSFGALAVMTVISVHPLPPSSRV